MAQREAQINLALTAIRTGKFDSIRAASRLYNVSELTLRAHLNGTTNRRTAHQYRKRLSIRQEEFLIYWKLEQDAQGLSSPSPSPSHARSYSRNGNSNSSYEMR